MKNTKNRLIAILITAMMVLTLMPMTAFAANYKVDEPWLIHYLSIAQPGDTIEYQAYEGGWSFTTLTVKEGVTLIISANSRSTWISSGNSLNNYGTVIIQNPAHFSVPTVNNYGGTIIGNFSNNPTINNFTLCDCGEWVLDGDECECKIEDIDVVITATINGTPYWPGMMAQLGDNVSFTITVTNYGRTPFQNVRVVCPLLGLDMSIPSLVVGASATCTGTVVVRYSHGNVINVVAVACANGIDYEGSLIIPIVVSVCPHEDTYDDVTLPATCEATGLKDIYCVDCDELLESGVEIPATGHNWNRGTVTVKPTTDADGEKVFTCKNCGETDTLILPKLTVEGVAVTDVFVEKLNGNKNNLTITVTEQAGVDRHGKPIEFTFTATFSINNNAAGTYTVGKYQVYVDTKGNTQIRACYIVE